MTRTTLCCILLCTSLLARASVTQTTLQVVWMVPFTSHPTASFVHNASSSVAALALGLETIRNESILPGHVINVTFIDTKCNSKQSIGAIFDHLLQHDVDVIFGPPCADVVKSVGELMSYRNVALINWVSVGQTITYKDELTTYMRTMAPISSLGGIMMSFYDYTGWRRFVIISIDRAEYRAAAATIESSIRLYEIKGFFVAHHYSGVKRNSSVADIDLMLNNIIREGRIIIMLIPREELRKYMLRAHALGLTKGDFQFIFTDTKMIDDDDVRFLSSGEIWRRGEADDMVARQAFQNVLYFCLGHTTAQVASWRDGAMAAFDNVFHGRTDAPLPSEPDEYSAYLHDTVIYYARLLNQSLSNNYTGSGDDLFDFGDTVYFPGLSGDVIINQLGERWPSFYVYDMDTSGSFIQVANLQFAIADTRIRMNSSFTKITWGDGRTTDDPYIPPDTPDCGFYNEFCTPDAPTTKSYEAVIIGVTVTMLFVFLGLFLLYR
ncbi:guanylate cyclase 2G-like [Dreissena polymorpha]|uniref:guanylate cyclase 2G-like n=1 Tax=Dreissena polymorpha TaxID=45954 RepID=UPI00226400D3|nr:guanylate cyclase 2G-like [Dreissena polymorpha]